MKNKKKGDDYSFLTKPSNHHFLHHPSYFPANQPAKKIFYTRRVFFLSPIRSTTDKKSLPKSHPHFAIHKKTLHLTLDFHLHQAERMLINLSGLHSPSLPSLLPFCSILLPPQGRRSPYLQRPRLLTRCTWRRAKRVRRSFTPPDIQPSCIRNCCARRRSRTVGFEIGCPRLMRLWQWLPFGTVVARCVAVGQRGGGMAAYWSRRAGEVWGRTAGDVWGREGGVGTG